MLIEIETSRLLLRQWRDTDYQPFAALNADPRVMEFFPEPLSKTQSDRMADRIRGLIEQKGWGFWAVEATGVAPFIGFVGLHEPSAELSCSPCVEVGWRLATPYWGKGYASEAAAAALRVGFEQLGLSEIVSFTAVLNQRSQAVMQRLGMQHWGEFFDHPAIPEGHPLQRHILYRLQQSRWQLQHS